jgi:hypothetical protein
MHISIKSLASTGFLLVFLLINGCAPSDDTSSGSETPTGSPMPNLRGVSVDSAEQIVLNNKWIPRILEESSPTIPEGQVTRTTPSEGASLEPNAAVSIYVSTGPAVILAKDAIIEWTNISQEVADIWNFKTPFISNEILNINLVNVALANRLVIE